jgi:hypothetical protein
MECPTCQGEGSVPLEAGYCNYDNTAIGVEFYGIGKAPGAAEAYFRAASPDVVLALIAQNQELATLLREFMELQLRGHTIADRLQFASAGREILGRANSALAKVGK